MKKLSVRGLTALGLVAVLGFATPVVALAGTKPPGATSQRNLQKEIAAYKSSRLAIQAQFRTAVNAAQASYNAAIITATTSSQRSAAQQTLETAIIQAAANRSAALTLLGKEPGTH